MSKRQLLSITAMLFFFQVAALDDSPEYYLAVRRNAQVNKGKTLEDVNTTTIKLKS